ncbi:DUF1007 family protein [Amaricoccus solimangrovi]|uniref:DUF1007 family protein n=1 Tax=Amaricoccus solimangrovi TaxID=2589815 RepID=UPI0015E4626B|nr:DUF1007 family protein [Amaricoccus solimangrovi]
MTGRGLALVLAAGLIAGSPAAAHPHIFIDGGVDFLFDGEGRLTRLRITWDYDPMTSLFMLEDLGIDGSKPLSDEDRARLAGYDTAWDEGYAGDTYLWNGEQAIGLSNPIAPEAEIRDGRVVLRFLRDLDKPFRPRSDARVEMYDPEYYYSYTLVGTPGLEGTHDRCRATIEPYEPTSKLTFLQKTLSAIPVDQTPDQANVGELFTDKARLRCD